ncbi:hypothetical protein BBJ28_00011556 [Nothophytophthora sp. Chile5]|nr:hypothetical protein BBJ28_00011556 [Nothophytophthora sp. Chile5]
MLVSSSAARVCVRRLSLQRPPSALPPSVHGSACRPSGGLAVVRLVAQQERVALRFYSTPAMLQPATETAGATHKPIPAKIKRKPTARQKNKSAASAVASKLVNNAENKREKAGKGGKAPHRKPMTQQQIEEEMLAKAAKGEQAAAASATAKTNESERPKPQNSTKNATDDALSTAPTVVEPKKPVALKDARTAKITMTLQEIAALQNTLPSADAIAELVTKLRRQSFEQAHTLFDLYRNYGNPFLDENFLTPGVLACCEAKKPAEGLNIVRDMLNQGRKVDEATLRALFDACDETSAAVEVVQLWDLMVRAGVTPDMDDYNRFLDICYRQEYLDGAVKVLKQLRLLRQVSAHTYMHWLLRASMVWRSDAFFDLLMEMRLSGVEPEIMSLTSLESGRKDRALTVMEGVRAVGLDPCFAMSSVFSSMQSSLYQNGPSYMALSKEDIKEAKDKFGDLKPIALDWPVKPIPQLLETQAAGLILQQETFRRLKRKQVNHIDDLLQLLPITANMTLNLRKQLLRMSLLVNTHRVRRDTKKICEEYDSGRSLIELSSAHNYPPVSLMRIILRARGMSQLSIKNALKYPADNLSKRDQHELRKSIEYDSIHKSDPFIGSPKYNANSLERAIEHFIKAKGIRLKTQEELCTEQLETYGRRVISPDILLLDPVIINGTPIRWIDAKNYYGAHIVSKRLISNQLANYVKEWGPGAIVFGMGYSDMFTVPGVMCLDTTPFPKSRKQAAKVRIKSFLYSCANVFRWKKHLGSELTQEYPFTNGESTAGKQGKKSDDDDVAEEPSTTPTKGSAPKSTAQKRFIQADVLSAFYRNRYFEGRPNVRLAAFSEEKQLQVQSSKSLPLFVKMLARQSARLAQRRAYSSLVNKESHVAADQKLFTTVKRPTYIKRDSDGTIYTALLVGLGVGMVQLVRGEVCMATGWSKKE